jgi:hypothetical protein
VTTSTNGTLVAQGGLQRAFHIARILDAKATDTHLGESFRIYVAKIEMYLHSPFVFKAGSKK